MAGGRQREFDKGQVLNAAMLVFWQKGYAGSSLADLTGAMGINKPSMYAAFGNKEQLFVQAAQHYMVTYAQPQFTLLYEPNVLIKQRVTNYLSTVISAQCAGERPLGCFVSLCIAEAANQCMPPAANDIIEQAKHYGEQALTELFNQEKASGKLSKAFNASLNATLIITFLHGTAAMARGGKSLTELAPLVDSMVANIFK